MARSAVVNVGEPFEREVAVAAEGALAHEVIAKSVGREPVEDVHGVDHSAQALGDLLTSPPLLINEAVPEDLFGRGTPADISMAGQRAQWNRVMSLPITWTSAGQSAMEPLVVGAIADGGDVVQQGVKPDVDRLLGVERDRNSPGESFPGDRHVLQLGLDEVDDLVPAALGLDEVGVRVVVREQPVADTPRAGR